MRVRCSRALILLGAIALLPACTGGSDRARAPTTTTASVVPTSTTTTAPTATSLSVSGAPWRLPAPTSRAVLLTDGTKLILLGGQDASHQSTAAGYVIDPTSGAPTSIGPLAPAVHDAAGVELGGRSLVIGGGTPPA